MKDVTIYRKSIPFFAKVFCLFDIFNSNNCTLLAFDHLRNVSTQNLKLFSIGKVFLHHFLRTVRREVPQYNSNPMFFSNASFIIGIKEL
jgi:hypothetical protein